MIAVQTIADEIRELKRDRRAILLAHHYQDSEIQELADAVGDSLELSRKAQAFDGDVIAFAGVYFMAETAKVLNPERVVVVPDADAGCSLVECCSADQLRAYRERHPDHVVVSYINTSVEVKALSDILCTSRNAVAVVNSIPPEKTVLFLPDVNLGNYVQRLSGRENMRIWQGACIVHATFPARRLAQSRAEHPDAIVAAHPECPPEVLALSDYIGSTSAIIQWCVAHPGQEFIIVTESGVGHSLRRLAPEKTFHFIRNEQCNCSECPYMRRNTLEKVRDCLRDLTPRIEIPADILQKARLPLERMLAVK